MDDLTAADYRLLLSLVGYAIVLPEQRYRIERELASGMSRAEGRDDRHKIEADMRAWAKGNCPGGRSGLDETGHERN